MSGTKFARPLEFKLSGAAQQRYNLVIHLLAVLVILLPFSLDTEWRLITGLLTGLSYIYNQQWIKKHYRGHLYLLEEQRWQWLNQQGEHELQYLSGSCLTPSTIILNFRSASGKRLSWTTWPGQLDDEVSRQLRVYVRSLTAGTAPGTT